jgi:hypothetical protein
VAILIIVAIHYSKKRSITGCVAAVGNGMTITDEKGKQIYALSGDTTGAKPGDRMKLKGKKTKRKRLLSAIAGHQTSAGREYGRADDEPFRAVWIFAIS